MVREVYTQAGDPTPYYPAQGSGGLGLTLPNNQPSNNQINFDPYINAHQAQSGTASPYLPPDQDHYPAPSSAAGAYPSQYPHNTTPPVGYPQEKAPVQMSYYEKPPMQPHPSYGNPHPHAPPTAPYQQTQAQYVQQQPVAQRGMAVGPGGGGNRNSKNLPIRGDGREWSNGLCSCCDDAGTCVLAWFCPSIVYAQNKHRLEHLSTHGSPDPTNGGSLCSGDCWLHYCLCSLFCAGCLLQMSNRTATRHRYTISGGGCGDCCVSTYCSPCGLTQESMELELEERSFGGYR